MKKILARAFLFTIICTVGYIMILTYNGIRKASGALDDRLPTTNILGSDDTMILSSVFADEFKVLSVYNFKGINPISISAIKEKFHVVLHHLDVTSSSELLKEIKFDRSNSDVTTDYAYHIIGDRIPYRIKYLAEPVGTKREIFINYDGDSFKKIISTDVILGYHFIGGALSIRYSPVGPTTLLFSAGESLVEPNKVEMDILLINKNDKIYLLVVSSIDNTRPINLDISFLKANK